MAKSVWVIDWFLHNCRFPFVPGCLIAPLPYLYSQADFEKQLSLRIDYASRIQAESLITFGLFRESHGGIEVLKKMVRYGKGRGVKVIPVVTPTAHFGYGGFDVEGTSTFNLKRWFETPQGGVSHLGSGADISNERILSLSPYIEKNLEWFQRGLEHLIQTGHCQGVFIDARWLKPCTLKKSQSQRAEIDGSVDELKDLFKLLADAIDFTQKQSADFSMMCFLPIVDLVQDSCLPLTFLRNKADFFISDIQMVSAQPNTIETLGSLNIMTTLWDVGAEKPGLMVRVFDRLRKLAQHAATHEVGISLPIHTETEVWLAAMSEKIDGQKILDDKQFFHIVANAFDTRGSDALEKWLDQVFRLVKEIDRVSGSLEREYLAGQAMQLAQDFANVLENLTGPAKIAWRDWQEELFLMATQLSPKLFQAPSPKNQ